MRTMAMRTAGLAVLSAVVLNGPLQAQAPQVGQAAPDFLLDRLDGGDAALADFRGKVVLIFFLGFN